MHHAFQALATRLAERGQIVDDAVASMERSLRWRLHGGGRNGCERRRGWFGTTSGGWSA